MRAVACLLFVSPAGVPARPYAGPLILAAFSLEARSAACLQYSLRRRCVHAFFMDFAAGTIDRAGVGFR